jgi:plasmid maintenance system killer protein
MQIDIKNKHLLELYESRKSRKYRLPTDVIQKFFMRMQQLEAAHSIHDLWKTPALQFERLRGYENRYSVRVTGKYRLEMEIDWEDEDKTKGFIHIIELSDHYGD